MKTKAGGTSLTHSSYKTAQYNDKMFQDLAKVATNYTNS